MKWLLLEDSGFLCAVHQQIRNVVPTVLHSFLPLVRRLARPNHSRKRLVERVDERSSRANPSPVSRVDVSPDCNGDNPHGSRNRDHRGFDVPKNGVTRW